MAPQDVIHAYRHLYRGLLRAVQYSTPARYTARDQLRKAFRQPDTTQGLGNPALDKNAIKRTIWFLEAAAKERGLEHKILRNLLKVAWHRNNKDPITWKLVQQDIGQGKKGWSRTERRTEEDKEAYRHYDMTVAMLNKTMGLCLR
ncbi:hypothetical protein jhhlp_001441 [Lomentospora prolificans]|uniref:DUF1763-domain-containing protein n=1 Tax=Lomentospora prolificans TaxID=41688 RepID=A0A2N3NI84_9PEZI|nr:hypothetical protein jhhlp_001441 [Lomentospora prolificans]